MNRFREHKTLQEIHEQLNALDTAISSGNNLAIIDWLNGNSIFQTKEAIDYKTKYFLSAILEELRDDLDGNAEYIRNTIKDYGKSCRNN